jgi:cytoplasmic iron level regulating protein YaaA (DUF328/UPF0246 family)
MPNFAILLSPSDGKQDGGNPFAPDMFDYRSSNTFNYFNELNPSRRELIAALQQAMDTSDDLEELLGVKGDALEGAIKANREVLRAPLMSALDRYSPGVLYEAMDFAGLPTGAQRRLLENGVIFSGLFGLLRPDDLIPNYFLRMEATLPEIGKVYQFWRPRMSQVLNVTLKDRVVWNMLSGPHEKAWDDDHSYRKMIEVQFVREEKGERKPVTQGVKPLRGQLVNYIVRETLEDVEGLVDWVHPEGYRYDAAASEFDEEARIARIVMVRKN